MGMDGAEPVAADPRVRALLTEPDAYFSAALRRAWPQARADVELELGRRARARSDGARSRRLLRMFHTPRQGQPTDARSRADGREP